MIDRRLGQKPQAHHCCGLSSRSRTQRGAAKFFNDFDESGKSEGGNFPHSDLADVVASTFSTQQI
jgi:hypothetical protein